MYFKHEMVTKGEIFTSCFNFDLNRSASKKKVCSKVSIFKVSVKENEVSTEKNSSRASIFATKASYISN